jgi:hypothetical protein
MVSVFLALHENLKKWAFYAAFCKRGFGLQQHATTTFAPKRA